MRNLIVLTWVFACLLPASISKASEEPKITPPTTRAATGWVLTYEVITETKRAKLPPRRQTISIQDQMVRIDMDSRMTMIVNYDTNEQFLVMHFMKSYQHISASQSKELNEQALKQLKRAAATTGPSQLKSTGQTAVINGYTATEYIAPGPVRGTVHEWMTKDLPEYGEIRSAMEKAFSKSPVIQQQMGAMGDVQGFPIRTVNESTQMKSTINFVSAEQKSLPPEFFQPPAGYTETQFAGPQQQ